jgi:hypothetical protein
MHVSVPRSVRPLGDILMYYSMVIEVNDAGLIVAERDYGDTKEIESQPR